MNPMLKTPEAIESWKEIGPSTELREKIWKEVMRVGYELVSFVPTRTHYLFTVFAKDSEARRFCIWTYNSDMGGLHNGDYMHPQEGEEDRDFLTRATKAFLERAARKL
jgi:hypothetical protein